MNYSKITLAALVALLFTACSDVENTPVGSLNNGSTEPVMGGAEEEQGVYALIPNLSMAGHARWLTTNNSSNFDERQWNSAAPKDAILRLAELDSVSLDTTGVFYITECYNSNGEFSFDSVSLNSPYAMLEIAPYADNGYWYWDGTWSFKEYDEDEGRYMTTYSVIVDVRESTDVDVNVITYLESFRIRNLVHQGKSFTVAKQQADREILDALGMYDASFYFDKGSYVNNTEYVVAMNYVNELMYEWSKKQKPLVIAELFGSTGMLASVDSVRDFFAGKAYWWRYPIEAWRRLPGEEGAAFLDGFIANLYGLGKCSAKNEGYSMELPGTSERYMDIKCSAGRWSLTEGRFKAAEKVDPTLETMTDDRDGRVYKVVTFNVDDQPQIWLAENLNYADSAAHPIKGIDSVPFNKHQAISPDYEQYINSLDSSYWRTLSRYALSEIIGSDSIKMENGHFQGLCPSGWHIPTRREWSRLFYFIEKETNGCKYYNDCLEFEESESFGYRQSQYLHQIGFGDVSVEAYAYLKQEDNGSWSMMSFDMFNWKPVSYNLMDNPSATASLRCIKN